ncbi:hypothetical protein [Exiguobacterium sp. s39]|uniref:hypothetical protein n=1 Tax=Exiguobacterium sp. s39 TaxID=2751198 RepID=UPI001BE59DB6|nr:hypothetical protein [Exiguobacterium sp. s39]
MRTPYDEYQETALWQIISEAINELIDNDDLEERTTHEHIVGYLYSKLEGRIKDEK